MKLRTFITIALLVSARLAEAQTDITKTDTAKIKQTPNASAISYQALSKFFQSSVSTGASGGFDFKASLFAINELFKGSDMELSKYYLSSTGTFQRNFQVALGIHKNSSGDLSTITGGVTYSPLNNRSKSDHNFQMALIKDITSSVVVFKDADDIYRKQYIDAQIDRAAHDKAWKAYSDAMKKYNKAQADSVLPATFVHIRDSLITSRKLGTVKDFMKAPQQDYDNASKQVDMGSLLTFSFNPGYDYNHKSFDTTMLKVEYLVGFGNPKKPYNLDITIEGILLRDTLMSAANLDRHKFDGKLGINHTLVEDDKSNPLIEFELQLEDQDLFDSPRYKNERQNTPTFNTVLTVHLSDQLSLPITLKYDLKKPNLLGIFNLSWNFETSKAANASTAKTATK